MFGKNFGEYKVHVSNLGLFNCVGLAASQKLIRNPGLLSLLEADALLQGMEEVEQAHQVAQRRAHYD